MKSDTLSGVDRHFQSSNISKATPRRIWLLFSQPRVFMHAYLIIIHSLLRRLLSGIRRLKIIWMHNVERNSSINRIQEWSKSGSTDFFFLEPIFLNTSKLRKYIRILTYFIFNWVKCQFSLFKAKICILFRI